ncbi:MAG: E3 binding domain-containing protein, partial [Sandaracinaceae bacterium]|nr:E3 binding domain-containing protein [Sandaracinaceae bacterium]
MAKIVGLPKLSPTMEEGTLARWAKKEGDSIELDELVAEVETDKATMEWRAFDRGVLLKILVEEGAILAPEAPVAILGDKGEDITALLAQLASGAAPKVPVAAAPAAAPSPPAAGAPAPAAAKQLAPSGRVLASPYVRKVAREHDLDLRSVPGSGPGGRIVKRDLDAALA